jgi:hypothetical protein
MGHCQAWDSLLEMKERGRVGSARSDTAPMTGTRPWARVGSRVGRRVTGGQRVGAAPAGYRGSGFAAAAGASPHRESGIGRRMTRKSETSLRVYEGPGGNCALLGRENGRCRSPNRTASSMELLLHVHRLAARLSVSGDPPARRPCSCRCRLRSRDVALPFERHRSRVATVAGPVMWRLTAAEAFAA